MIVFCASFGSLWWLRPGHDAADTGRYSSRAALFNTTGFKGTGARERRNWTVPGVVRFNAGPCIEQRLRLDSIEPGTFQTPGLEQSGTQNRLLLERRAKSSTVVDAVLLSVSSKTIGRIKFGADWRTPGVKIVCASAFNGMQETLLLMPQEGQLQTETGTWRLEWDNTSSMKASLKVTSER